MAKAQNITEMAFQITADASGFIGEMTRTATTFEKTVQGITKSQRELGAERLDDGILLNSLGENVEGLKNWQIALGYSRDATGQLLNKNKQLVEGLTTVQQKMGMYVGDLGNVYDKQGMLIRQGAEAIAKEKEKAKAIEDAAKAREAESRALERAIALDAEKQAKAVADANRAVEESLKGIGDTLKFSTNMLVTFSVGGGESAKRLKVLSAAMASFTSTAQMIPMISRWYKSLTVATNLQTGAIQKQTVAQGLLNIVSGNWLTIAGSLAAAGLTFAVTSQMEQMGNEAGTAAGKIENLTDVLKRLNAEAEKSGRSSWGIGDINTVVGELSRSQNQNMFDWINGLSDGRKEAEQLVKQMEMLQKLSDMNEAVSGWSSPFEGIDWDEFFRMKKEAESLGVSFELGETSKEALDRITKRKNELDAKNSESIQGIADIYESIITGNKSELERMRESIAIVERAVANNINPDGKGDQTLSILKSREAELISKEQEKLLSPLQNYISNVEKVSKSFEWLNNINDEEIKKSNEYKNALADRTKQLERAKLQDSMTSEQLKLYDQIQSYVSPWKKFGETAQNLTDLVEKQEVNLEGWIDASKKNEEALLGSLKYGSYIKKAQEGLLSVDDKIHEAFAEIERAGKEMQLTRNVIEAAKLEAEKDLRDVSKKREQEVRTDLAAAERGSLEAYRIIGNAQQDRQVKAIKDQTARLIAANREDTTTVVQALKNFLSDVGIMNW